MVVGFGPMPALERIVSSGSLRATGPLPGSLPEVVPRDGKAPSVLRNACSPWSPGPPRPGPCGSIVRNRLIELCSCWSTWLVSTCRRKSTVAAPVTTLTTVKRISMEATSLLRRVQEPGDAQRARAGGGTGSGATAATGVVSGGDASRRSAGGLEDIADASHRVDHR